MTRYRALSLLSALALAACASTPQTGMMAADWTPPAKSGIAAQKVIIAWESESDITGNMTFTLGAGGQRFVGPYMLLETIVQHVETQPLYNLWDSPTFDQWAAGGSDYWFSPGWGVTAWADHYNGRVVSGLHGDRGGSARCHFTLSNTGAGLPGGGTGECQLSDGGLLQASF